VKQVFHDGATRRNLQNSKAAQAEEAALAARHRREHMSQVATRETLPEVLQAEAMIQATDVSGTRTVAVKVQDDSMEPLFSKEELIFVNPDLEWKHDDYVIAHHRDGGSEAVLLRQVKRIGPQCILHPLNRKYADIPVTNEGAVRGEVVRLRKTL